MLYTEFIEYCNKGKCLRKYKIGNNCSKSFKQESCFRKFEKQKLVKSKKQDNLSIEKKERNLYQQMINREVEIRDKYCLVTNILDNDQKRDLTNQYGSYIFSSVKDCAHILPKNLYPTLRYDKDNIILINRFFHERLDKFLDLITGEYIGLEGKKRWIEKIMQGNGLWDSSYSYDKFESDKTG